jgi:hypothetical protein
MTKLIFETTDFGKIEITRTNNDSFAGEAYFFGRDWLVDVDATGHFSDLDGRRFQVFYPYFKDTNPATLEVETTRRIGTAKVA